MSALITHYLLQKYDDHTCLMTHGHYYFNVYRKYLETIKKKKNQKQIGPII